MEHLCMNTVHTKPAELRVRHFSRSAACPLRNVDAGSERFSAAQGGWELFKAVGSHMLLPFRSHPLRTGMPVGMAGAGQIDRGVLSPNGWVLG
jgi:hypothetical protein